MSTFDRVWFVGIIVAVSIFAAEFNNAMAANAYYVATYGDDGNSCDTARDADTPKRNIMGMSGGIGCLQSPGDQLVIREGTYDESITNEWLPSGSDWDNAFTVAAYPGENVVIKAIGIATDENIGLNLSYWIFDGLHVVNNIPGGGEAIWMRSPDHLRFTNMEVTTAGRANIPGTSDQCVQGGGRFIEFINVEVHDCGDPTVGPQSGAGRAAYGFYWWGSDSVFDHIKLHDTTGYGFHIYNSGCDTRGDCPNRNTVRYSEIYNTGTLQGSDGIFFAYGDGNQAYGNTITNNSSGIGVGYGASNTQVSDNAIRGNVYNGVSVGAGWGSRPDSNTLVQNNTISDNGEYGIQNSAAGTPQGEPIGTIIQNNSLSNNGHDMLDTGVGTIR